MNNENIDIIKQKAIDMGLGASDEISEVIYNLPFEEFKDLRGEFTELSRVDFKEIAQPKKHILTKELAEQFMMNPDDLNGVNLSRYDSIEDSAAEVLSKYDDSEEPLPLESLKDISDVSVDLLSGLIHDLSGVKKLSDKAIESLSKKSKGYLYLGIDKLSDSAAKSLSKHTNIQLLGFFQLKKISNNAAELLSKFQGEELLLNCLVEINASAAKSIAKYKGDLSLRGLKKIDNIAQSLAKHKGGICLDGLLEISDADAESLANCAGDLDISSIKELSDESARALAKHEGNLWLSSNDKEQNTKAVIVSETAADYLSKKNGKISSVDPQKWVEHLTNGKCIWKYWDL